MSAVQGSQSQAGQPAERGRHRIGTRSTLVAAAALIAAFLAGCIGTDGGNPAGARTQNAQATAYLRNALDWIEANSIVHDRLDWTILRREAWAIAGKARTPADTYPAIRFVISALNDHHSGFHPAGEDSLGTPDRIYGPGYTAVGDVVVEVFPGSSAEQAGLRVGDRIESSTGAADRVILKLTHRDVAGAVRLTVPFAAFNRAEPPRGMLLAGGIAYVELTSNEGSSSESYAPEVQQIVRDLDQSPPCGWIVDLRRNIGGYFWPMLVGIGPVLGEGLAGGFVDRMGKHRTWEYQNGKGIQIDETKYQLPEAAYRLTHALPPVAVLTSGLTASAGEALSVAFYGRPSTRAFGEPTYGIPTGIANKTLLDGARITLATGIAEDRAGNTYSERLTPDEPVPMDWALFDSASDPAVRAAASWLQRQPGCSGP